MSKVVAILATMDTKGAEADFMRQEIGDGAIVLILDTSQRKGLELHAHRKVAKKVDLAGRVPAEELKDAVDQLRNLKNQKNATVVKLADEPNERPIGLPKCMQAG